MSNGAEEKCASRCNEEGARESGDRGAVVRPQCV